MEVCSDSRARLFTHRIAVFWGSVVLVFNCMKNHLCRRCAVVLGLVCGTLSGWGQTYWQNVTSPAISDDISAVAFANGTFEAATAQGNVLSSPDGISWTSQAASPGTWLTSITYGDGSWVVVGANGTILVSDDLKTWVKVISPTNNKLNAVVFDASPYVNSSGSFVGSFLAVGDNGTILSSSDAKTWVTAPSGITSSLTGIAPFFEDVVVCGDGGIVLNNVQAGGAPTVIETGASSGLNAIIFGPANADDSANNYIAVGGHGLIIHSPMVVQGMVVAPPTNWTNAVVPNRSATLWGLSFGNSSYVATGDNGSILASPDGVNWTQQFPGTSYQNMSTATLLGVVFSPSLQRFVVVGKGGAILISNAPQSVLANVSTRGTVSSTQSLIGGFVVEGSSPRSVLVRADGPVLGTFGVSDPLPDPVLTVYDSKQNVIFQNSGWSNQTGFASVSAAAAVAGAFALPSGSKDSASVFTLSPGAYTAVITTAGGNSGTALFEAYIY
jgi:hypothetical protein